MKKLILEPDNLTDIKAKIVETKNGAKALKIWKKSEIHFDNLVDLEKSKMLQNESLVAIVAVHTAENEPSKVCLDFFISSLLGP